MNRTSEEMQNTLKHITICLRVLPEVEGVEEKYMMK